MSSMQRPVFCLPDRIKDAETTGLQTCEMFIYLESYSMLEEGCNHPTLWSHMGLYEEEKDIDGTCFRVACAASAILPATDSFTFPVNHVNPVRQTFHKQICSLVVLAGPFVLGSSSTAVHAWVHKMLRRCCPWVTICGGQQTSKESQ